jgi:hypothetical protein
MTLSGHGRENEGGDPEVYTRGTVHHDPTEQGRTPEAVADEALDATDRADPSDGRHPQGRDEWGRRPRDRSSGMQVRASVLTAVGGDWTTATLELHPPQAEEVLVRVEYAGLCRSDEHRRHEGSGGRIPLIGGHEGTGVIEAVGSGVTRFRPGDHVILSVLPQCGVCRFCTSGRSRMCDLTVNVPTGAMPDGTYRAHLD